MPSLYARYIHEREEMGCVEAEHGFATYRVNLAQCYIRDIYVEPAYRKTGLASELADKITEIAKSRGCSYLTGSVAPEATGSTESLKVLLAYGFKLYKIDTNLIWFIKEI